MPQPPPHLLLLQLLLRQSLLLLPRLELHIAPLLRLGINSATRHTRRGAAHRTAHGATPRSTVLETVHRDGEVAFVRDAPVRNVPLLGTQRADELFVVGDHDDAAFVVADRDGEAAEGVAVQVVGGFVEDEEVGVIPHGAGEDDFDLLAAGETGDFVVVRDVGVETDVFEVFGDDFGREFAEAEAFAGGFVVVEFLDEFVEAEVHEGFAGDLGVVFWKHVDPFSGRGSANGLYNLRAKKNKTGGRRLVGAYTSY